MRALIVDDAMVFRSIVRQVLEKIPGVTITGTASNGQSALSLLKEQAVDLITLDMNMPVMDGLATLRALKEIGCKAKVLVFAAKTSRSAQETIEALQLGAVDFIVKPEADSIDTAIESIRSQLESRIRAFQGEVDLRSSSPAYKGKAMIDVESFKPRAVVIASSTGGPVALEQALSQLTPPLRVPVFIAQHMPPTFTKYLGERLQSITGVKCREAIQGETIEAGTIYIAPGDWHMRIVSEMGVLKIGLDQSERMHHVRPAADLLFFSAVKHYGNTVAGMVLTGMGMDGAGGCISIKEAGGAVMIQDKASAVVWGMPGAVHEAGAFDKMGDLAKCALILKKWCKV